MLFRVNLEFESTRFPSMVYEATSTSGVSKSMVRLMFPSFAIMSLQPTKLTRVQRRTMDMTVSVVLIFFMVVS
ncbi:MAG TPA: hypothetical protein DIC57_02155 [Sphaerochaeta sp.]|nr:hypothetical protein [Sphaerochaeta sp.]